MAHLNQCARYESGGREAGDGVPCTRPPTHLVMIAARTGSGFLVRKFAMGIVVCDEHARCTDIPMRKEDFDKLVGALHRAGDRLAVWEASKLEPIPLSSKEAIGYLEMFRRTEPS